MSGPAQPLCKFHQYGHCKFSQTCKHFHTKDTCTSSNCDRSQCTARHPKICVYFLRLGRCKFGTDCSYLHDVPSPNGDIVNAVKVMQEELQFVTNALKTKETKINEFKEKVDKLENIIMTSKI